ncbi:IS982 family transposase, partial [Cyanobacteria bacterium FACHB-472]|nr:IS982 family transposase [Cyanobacteria bacterium FACHB-472]
MLSLEALFCHADDFCRSFEPRWEQQLLEDDRPQRQRSRSLCLSETLTI